MHYQKTPLPRGVLFAAAVLNRVKIVEYSAKYHRCKKISYLFASIAKAQKKSKLPA